MYVVVLYRPDPDRSMLYYKKDKRVVFKETTQKRPMTPSLMQSANAKRPNQIDANVFAPNKTIRKIVLLQQGCRRGLVLNITQGKR
jgi:hypothetical protein